MTSNAYERGFRKIAMAQEIDERQPRLYRTGGSTLLLLRTDGNIVAADATGCASSVQGGTVSDRLAAVADCLGAAGAEVDWQQLIRERPLPVEVRGSEVWVCVDLCQ